MPPSCAPLFASPERQQVLRSHRGWDAGAAEVGRAWAALHGQTARCQPISRLVCDANRSEDHPRVHAPWLDALSEPERQELIATYHRPHREAVAQACAAALAQGPVLHLAVHSFVPVLGGRQRPMQVGLLYDPRRPAELSLCRAWRRELARLAEIRVDRNRPYRGWTDGLCTTLRARFSSAPYSGVEVELNQGWLPSVSADGVATWLDASLRRALLDATPRVTASTRS